jgi:hypothetical protein
MEPLGFRYFKMGTVRISAGWAANQAGAQWAGPLATVRSRWPRVMTALGGPRHVLDGAQY